MIDIDPQAALRRRLLKHQQEHRALDEQIAQESERPLMDQIMLRRLKKRKLALKDEIARLSDLLEPDIIA